MNKFSAASLSLCLSSCVELLVLDDPTTEDAPAEDSSAVEDGPVPTSDATTASGTSTGHAVVCGDGVAEDVEECDDGPEDPNGPQPGDHCVRCVRDRLVFVSSAILSSGQLGGIDGADARCIELATAADLPNPDKFRAWLSTSEQNARDRVSLHPDARYLLTDELTVVVSEGRAIVGSYLENSIHSDENGDFVDHYVWTGTSSEGMGMRLNCANWLGDEYTQGIYGNTDATDAQWTNSEHPANPSSCAAQYRIYCFEKR